MTKEIHRVEFTSSLKLTFNQTKYVRILSSNQNGVVGKVWRVPGGNVNLFSVSTTKLKPLKKAHPRIGILPYHIYTHTYVETNM